MTLLSGLRIVEISGHGAAAWAAAHCASWGARVRVLEPADGTPLRHEPPHYYLEGERRSATWQWLSLGKAVERLPADAALQACDDADIVFVESELAGDVLGVEPRELSGRLEGKTTSILITPFASDGPYAHYGATDLGLNALGGWMSVMGSPDREPLSAGRNILARIAGVDAFVAALIALRHVRQGGAHQHVELSMHAVAASMVSAPWLIESMAGFRYERTGNAWPLGAMACADGYVGIPPLTAQHWESLCRLMGMEDVLEDPRGRDPAYRARHSEELSERVAPWLSMRRRGDIFEEAQSWRLPAAPIETVSERLACPQLAGRGFWQAAKIEGQTLRVPRVPYRIGGVEPDQRARMPGRGAGDPRDLRNPAPHPDPPKLPYDGLRILDLTTFWSGPSATSLLGALGADVIKVESIQRPDPYRYQIVTPKRERWWEWSPVWNDCNPNKRSITLDLTSETGLELFAGLVAQADVVISNFSNRVMPNLGLTSKRLLELNPDVVAVTMPGYGPGGPWEDYVGYAIAFELLSCGAMTGYTDGAPMYAGGFCDPLVGRYVVAAIELALWQRDNGGHGVEVEVPQSEVLDSLLAPEQIAVQLGAPDPNRRGNRHDWMAPHGAYRVAGRDEWLTIAVTSDAEFAALCEVLGITEVARDPRFATVSARKQNEPELDALVGQALAAGAGVELESELQAAGVKACRVAKGYCLTDDANLRHVSFFQSLRRDVTGEHVYRTWPFRFSRFNLRHRGPPPLLGEHNVEVFSSLLGLSDDQLEHLADHGVIGTAPVVV